MEQTIRADKNLIAYCGLYCGACVRFLKGKCPGCAKNDKASWCAVRNCCIQSQIKSCADCKEYPDVGQCRKFNNMISKIFGFIFRSDRRKCVQRIREAGYSSFAREMATSGRQSLPR